MPHVIFAIVHGNTSGQSPFQTRHIPKSNSPEHPHSYEWYSSPNTAKPAWRNSACLPAASRWVNERICWSSSPERSPRNNAGREFQRFGAGRTWCCRVASLNVGSRARSGAHSLFALWPRGISFGPGRRWALGTISCPGICRLVVGVVVA